MPRLANVRAIRQKMPMGATFRTRPIMCIITALNCVKKRLTVATFLPRRPRMKPRMSAKKMICSIVPLFMAAMMLVGMMLMSMSAMVWSVVVVLGSTCTRRAMSRPMPGLVICASTMAMVTASAVVHRYMRMVPTPTLPSIFGSLIDAAPQTMEQNTSGTTSICIRRMNHWPST